MPQDKSVKVAVVAMTTGANKTHNIDMAIGYIRRASELGADWVMLPEVFAFHGPYADIYENAELDDGPLNQKLSDLARELKITLFAGSVGERPDRDNLSEANLRNRDGHRKVYNTSYVFGPTGALRGKYRKTHLFSLKDGAGQTTHCETDGFLAGDAANVIEIDGFRVGMSICYDLRFSELFTVMNRQGPVDVLAVPSAFTLGTGMYHWELLLRARAVEGLCYVVAANQTGAHAPGKSSFGHSMIIDPWGHKIVDTGQLPGVAMAIISQAKIASYRAMLPALSNRRPEVYK